MSRDFRKKVRHTIISAVLAKPVISLARLSKNNDLTILTYHWVGAKKSSFLEHTHQVDLDAFEEQMRYISRHYRVVSLDDIAETQKTVPQAHMRPSFWYGAIGSQNRRSRDHRNAVAITFDDAYSCIATDVAPILERLNIPATVFVSGSLINNERLLWRHAVKHISEEGQLAFFSEELKNRTGINFAITAQLSRKPDLGKEIDSTLIMDAAMAVFKRMGWNSRTLAKAHHLYLTQNEISLLNPKLWTVGHHTWSHPVLATLSQSHQEQEIIKGADYIKQFGKLARDYFAIPFGRTWHYNKTTIDIATKLGSRLILLSNRGFESPPFTTQLKRIAAPATKKDLQGYLAGIHPDIWYRALFKTN